MAGFRVYLQPVVLVSTTAIAIAATAASAVRTASSAARPSAATLRASTRSISTTGVRRLSFHAIEVRLAFVFSEVGAALNGEAFATGCRSFGRTGTVT